MVYVVDSAIQNLNNWGQEFDKTPFPELLSLLIDIQKVSLSLNISIRQSALKCSG